MNKPAPLSYNQYAYLQRTFLSWLNVAEGGKRGGKNVLNTLAFALNLEQHPDRIHLIAGVTGTSAKLNIIECDGYGLANYFEGRYREGEYKKRDALFVKTKIGEKIVLISGLGKSGDEKKIKGNSYGSAYITEVNECHLHGIRECFDRTMASKNRKIFHDLNPKEESHFYYADILNFHEEKQNINPSYGFNYGHFTIADNLSLTQHQVDSVINTYDKKSVWFLRDVLGRRKAAEGLIYPHFASNNDAYITDDFPKTFNRIFIGIDWGDNGSKHSFTATGIVGNFQKLIVLSTELHNAKDLTPADVEKKVVAFVAKVVEAYGKVDLVCADHSNTMINGCNVALKKAEIRVAITQAYKCEITERILTTSKLMATKRLQLTRDCKSLQDALSTAVWDAKHPDKRLDDGTTDVDSLDSFEYSWSRYIKSLSLFNSAQ